MKASDILNGWNFIKEDGLGNFMIEIDERFYISNVNKDFQVKSVLPADSPKNGGSWVANAYSEKGIEYVAKGRSKSAAYKMWKKYIVPLTKEYI